MTLPIILCILDGWGLRDNEKHNAIAQARTPHWDDLCKNGAMTQLNASEHAVGLPPKQMGNSEVGHMNIGAGRIVLHDLPRINLALENGDIFTNHMLQEMIDKLSNSDNKIHLIGLLSDGGVHSHQNHMATFANHFLKNDVQVNIHAITDGRDTSPMTALEFLKDFRRDCPDAPIVTIGGRYFAMDRDENWDRMKQAVNAIIVADRTKIPCFNTPFGAINAGYQQNVTSDEFIPCAISDANYDGIKAGDAVFFMNFRADRIRQLAKIFAKLHQYDNIFVPELSGMLGMVPYSEELDDFIYSLFPAHDLKNVLGQVIADAGLKQARMAETEKYAHVTFFFNGGVEKEFLGERRVLVPSVKVATYDKKPEMSAGKLVNEVLDAIHSGDDDLIIVNFANPDMVGHTGDFAAALQAVEVIDNVLGQLKKAAMQHDAALLVTADHGNIETMFDDEKGVAHTAHTLNPVPFIIYGKDAKDYHLRQGNLCDIAPTILSLLAIKQPSEMTGKSLLT